MSLLACASYLLIGPFLPSCIETWQCSSFLFPAPVPTSMYRPPQMRFAILLVVPLNFVVSLARVPGARAGGRGAGGMV